MVSEKLFKSGLEIQDGAFLMRVSKDRLCAIVVGNPDWEGEQGERPLDREQLVRELAENEVANGILDEPQSLSSGGLCVARGLAPRHGDDARIRLHVKPALVRVPKLKDPDKDQVDFRELGSIVNVDKDRLLMEKIPPTVGVVGRDIFGAEIPPKPGKDRKIKCGSGVYLSEDELKVYAKHDGKFVMADDKPSVFEEHMVSGDIDLTVGNIAFGGKGLIIQGEVLPGFSVKCRGDVTINRGMSSALVMAGGNLTVRGCVVGEDAVLRAKGNITIDFMENGPKVEAGGDLTINDSVIQCQALVGKNLYAKVKGKGVVVGGKYIVGGSVYVNQLGSDAEVNTTVHVGVVPALQARKQKLDEDVQLWAERLNEIIKNISTLEKLKKEQGAMFPEERRTLLKKYQTAMPKTMDRVNELTEELKRLEQDMDQMIAESVFVFGALYPGAAVSIGSATRFITTPEEKCVVYFDQVVHQILVRKMSREEQALFE